MSFNDTLKKIQEITDNLAGYSDNVEAHLKEWTEHTIDMKSKLEKQKAELDGNYKCIHKKIQEIETIVSENQKISEDLDNEVLERQTKLATLEKEEAALCLKVSCAEQALLQAKQGLNLSDSHQIKQRVLEDRIKAYKVLTGTSFDYSGAGGVSGYVFNKHKAKYKAFNFDPKEDSEKIAEKLWNVTEKLAKEE